MQSSTSSETRTKTCPQCSGALMVEDLGDGKKRQKCGGCGLNEIVDREGRKLLTGATESKPSAGLLTEDMPVGNVLLG